MTAYYIVTPADTANNVSTSAGKLVRAATASEAVQKVAGGTTRRPWTQRRDGLYRPLGSPSDQAVAYRVDNGEDMARQLGKRRAYRKKSDG